MKSAIFIPATAIIVSAGLFSAFAIAQTQPQPQPPAQDQSAPVTQAPAQPPRLGREGGGWGGGMMMSGGMGRGGGSRMQGLSDADRTAFFEARLAAMKAGLMLNETQQRLWPAVETAIREMMKQRQEWAERLRKEGQPANPVDRMKRAGEMMSTRGAALTKLADAMKPFHDSLSDEQKRRAPMLMRPMGGQQGGPGMGQQHRFGPQGGPDGNNQGARGQFRQRWQQQNENGPQGGAPGAGPRNPQNEGRRWRQDAPGQGFGSGDDRGDWRRM